MKTLRSVLFLLLIIGVPRINGRTSEDHTPLVIPTTTSATIKQADHAVTNAPSVQPTVPATVTKPCFNGKEFCPRPAQNQSGCKCQPHPQIHNALVCCNVTDVDEAIACAPKLVNDSHWQYVHIVNATLANLNVSRSYFNRLLSLSITDGSIKTVISEFPRHNSLKCLNLTNNNIKEIYSRAFHNIKLQELDLSFNNLSVMPNIPNHTNLTIDIGGNDFMLCKSLLDLKSVIEFKDQETTHCLTNKTFNWFNSTERVPLHLAHLKQNLFAECPSIAGYGNCTCTAEQMVYLQEIKQWQFAAKVDCSNLGLIALPDKLPHSTHTLNVSNNNITTLEALSTESYKNLVRFYADDNQIRDIVDLEGTKFLEKFDSLHLRYNRLKTIPIYVLTNAFDRNIPSGKLVYLEGNKLTCDCNSVKVLRSWLLERQHNIVDYDKILCENVQQKILDLSEVKLCQSQHDWTDYIYYLISGEIILLVALVMKVSYDYWVFKTAGYLPWPASKMPKLPCDWLCES